METVDPDEQGFSSARFWRSPALRTLSPRFVGTGIALATGAPTTLLLGDLTLQHDLGALVTPDAGHEVRLRVILLDDHGGAIFASLEQGQPVFAASFDRVFRAPQGVELGSVVRSMGWRTSEVTCIQSLRQVLARPSSDRELLHIVLGQD